VVLGKEKARWGYLALLAGAFLAVLVGVGAEWLPVGALLMWLALPIGIFTTRTLFRHYNERSLIRANAYTILLHLAAGTLLALGLFLTRV
jgi:1,4-dihydroxy-2-naphthoate octaprenyltransferase